MTLPPLPELKPCPFCEGEKHFKSSNGVESNYVVCAGCGAEGPAAETTAAAHAAWNRRAAIAAHVPEAAFGNIAAVPAQPVAWTHVDYLTAAEHARQNDYPFAISAQARGPTPTHDVPLYAAPQAVPVPAGWSVTYDGKRASYIYADQETAEFEAQQVGGTARAVAVYLAAAPKEQPHE